mmetsp:Transcript_21485/g.48798  ORF Transcript_21485/g.48798 Transcript_21485/m.48798 type:complete len:306 (+) Transcript_21485:2860-3777(+)
MLWTAEALWNLAVTAMSVTFTDAVSICSSRSISSDLFARAHDFALLSEEEEGKSLSRGFLDMEQKPPFPPFRINGIHEDEIETTELASEFSAQCLLLSIANVIDSVWIDDGEKSALSSRRMALSEDERTKMRARLRKSLHRVKMAKNEFRLCRSSSVDNGEEEQDDNLGMLSWLALRCMLELGDDDTCLTSLKYGGLMTLIMSSSPTHLSNLLEKEQATDDSSDDNSKLSHMFLCACRAEENKMLASAKTLFQQCADGMSSAGIKTLATYRKATLGIIHKNLIKLSDSVSETVELFSSFCENKKK